MFEMLVEMQRLDSSRINNEPLRLKLEAYLKT